MLPPIRRQAPGHLLIVPFAHRAGWFSLRERELAEIPRLLEAARHHIVTRYPDVTGFSIASEHDDDDELAAISTRQHAHVHLLPRRVGDPRRVCHHAR